MIQGIYLYSRKSLYWSGQVIPIKRNSHSQHFDELCAISEQKVPFSVDFVGNPGVQIRLTFCNANLLNIRALFGKQLSMYAHVSAVQDFSQTHRFSLKDAELDLPDPKFLQGEKHRGPWIVMAGALDQSPEAQLVLDLAQGFIATRIRRIISSN